MLSAPLVSAIFVFGASMLDAGTNSFIPNSTSIANFPPYGESYFHHPTGRFSNGLLIPDFLARLLGLHLIPPYLQPDADHSYGANFASGGSGLFDGTNLVKRVVPFSVQFWQFKQLISTSEALNQKLPNSLVMINTGSNDLKTYWDLSSEVPLHDFLELLTSRYTTYLKEICSTGIRKILVIGTGPLGCELGARVAENSTGCLNYRNEAAVTFNTLVKSAIQEVGAAFPEVDLIYFETYDMIQEMLKNPRKYEFTNTEEACCGAGPRNAALQCGKPVPPDLSYVQFLCPDPSVYLYWDHIHPTQAAYRLISEAIWDGDAPFVVPKNLKTLVTMVSTTVTTNLRTLVTDSDHSEL